MKRRFLHQHGSSPGTGTSFRFRPGFTLFELLIVLSVITLMAGLAWPRIAQRLKTQRIKDDAEMVRLQLDRARVQAVEQGIAYQFRYEPNGRRYVLLPFELLGSAMEGGASSTPGPQRPTLTQPSPSTGFQSPGGESSGNTQLGTFPVFELSEECRFHTTPSLSGQATITEQLNEAWLGYLQDGATYADVTWSTPVIYYPNGSATDGTLTVQDKDRRYQELIVRGLTGTVTVSPVQRRREMFGG